VVRVGYTSIDEVVVEDRGMFPRIRNDLSSGRATPPATPRRRSRAKSRGNAVRGGGGDRVGRAAKGGVMLEERGDVLDDGDACCGMLLRRTTEVIS